MTRTILLLSLVLACSGGGSDEPDASANLTALAGSGVQGTVEFTETDDGVRVDLDVTGLTPGKHGWHVHEFGDCSTTKDMMGADVPGGGAGTHFNPDMVEHGDPDSATHHPGDFGNFEADADGHGTMSRMMDASTFGLDGKFSIIGRAVIIHEKVDDFGQPTGNAGGRLACGIVKNADGSGDPVPNPAAG